MIPEERPTNPAAWRTPYGDRWVTVYTHKPTVGEWEPLYTTDDLSAARAEGEQAERERCIEIVQHAADLGQWATTALAALRSVAKEGDESPPCALDTFNLDYCRVHHRLMQDCLNAAALRSVAKEGEKP